MVVRLRSLLKNMVGCVARPIQCLFFLYKDPHFFIQQEQFKLQVLKLLFLKNKGLALYLFVSNFFCFPLSIVIIPLFCFLPGGVRFVMLSHVFLVLVDLLLRKFEVTLPISQQTFYLFTSSQVNHFLLDKNHNSRNES